MGTVRSLEEQTIANTDPKLPGSGRGVTQATSGRSGAVYNFTPADGWDCEQSQGRKLLEPNGYGFNGLLTGVPGHKPIKIKVS